MVREASGILVSAVESADEEAAEDDSSEAFDELSSSLVEHDAKQPIVIVIAIKNADIYFIIINYPFLLNVLLII